MVKVKRKKKDRLVAVRLTAKELDCLSQKRPEETLSDFIRAAIRHFARERAEREGT